MRKATVQAVLPMFSPRAKIVCNWFFDNGEMGKCSPKRIFEQVLEQANDKTINYHNIRIHRPLKPIKSDVLVGKLAYERVEQSKQKIIIFDFEVIRKSKSFGTRQIEVWEVLLLGN